jgi:hypothetical protein
MSISLIIVVVILLLLAVLLTVPFRLTFGLAKEGASFQGFYKISYLGFTLNKGEISQPPPETLETDIGTRRIEIAQESQDTGGSQSAKEPVRDYGKPKGMEIEKKSLEGAYEKADNGSVRNQLPVEPRLIMDAIPQMVRIIIDFIRSINIRRLSCNIAFGLDDPVDTAAISGYLWSIASAAGLYRADITIDPRFDGEQLEGSILADLEARMLWFVVAAVKALEDVHIRKLALEIVRG